MCIISSFALVNFLFFFASFIINGFCLAGTSAYGTDNAHTTYLLWILLFNNKIHTQAHSGKAESNEPRWQRKMRRPMARTYIQHWPEPRWLKDNRHNSCQSKKMQFVVVVVSRRWLLVVGRVRPINRFFKINDFLSRTLAVHHNKCMLRIWLVISRACLFLVRFFNPSLIRP